MAKFEMTDDGLYYCFDQVADLIPPEFATLEGVQAYIDDEVFENAILNRYVCIDIERCAADKERFEKRKKRTAKWLMEQMAVYEVRNKMR